MIVIGKKENWEKRWMWKEKVNDRRVTNKNKKMTK